MKKITFFFLSSALTGILTMASFSVAFAQEGARTASGLSDSDKLAITAGAAQACNADADKLDTYEMIASRILVNPTRSEKEENAVLTAYAQKKFQTYQEQKGAPEISCSEVLARFYKLPLFRSTVYRDGTLKLPDGKIIKPVRPLKPAPKAKPKQPMTKTQQSKQTKQSAQK